MVIGSGSLVGGSLVNDDDTGKWFDSGMGSVGG